MQNAYVKFCFELRSHFDIYRRLEIDLIIYYMFHCYKFLIISNESKKHSGSEWLLGSFPDFKSLGRSRVKW